MRLTPLDIRKQEFAREFRGYDAEEVNAFLQMLANQWEEVKDEHRRQEEKVRELEAKLRHYENVEEALQEALQTTRESSRKALQNAEDEAALMIEKAEIRALEITRDAERERHEMKRETGKLSSRKSEIVTRLRAFLMSEMELLARYEGDDPVGFIKLLPADEKRLRQLSDRFEEDESTRPDAVENMPDLRDEPTPRPGAAFREGEGGYADAEPAATFAPDEPGDPAPGPTRPASEEPVWTPHVQEDRTAAPSDPAMEDTEGGQPERAHEEEDVISGQGWTARTVISRPSEQQAPPTDTSEEPESEGDQADNEETTTRASSEEIEKIRRILSDLD